MVICLKSPYLLEMHAEIFIDEMKCQHLLENIWGGVGK